MNVEPADEANYLGLLTLAWTYVLSAYWSETQNGIISYTNHTASCSTTIEQPGQIFLTLDASETEAEIDWWCAIFAPRNGWQASIHRHGQKWSSPWSLNYDNEHSFPVIVRQSGRAQNESRSPAPTFKDSLEMLRRFATKRRLLRQASMAFIAALIIPTHNLWGIPVRPSRVWTYYAR